MEHIQPGIKSALEAAGMDLRPETSVQRETRIAEAIALRNALPTTTQPVPTGIEAEICEFIARRQQLGIHKYGQTVADNPLPLDKWLQHMIEELLDGAIYAKRAQAEITTKKYTFSDMHELVILFADVESHLPNNEEARTAATAVRKKIFQMINGGTK